MSPAEPRRRPNLLFMMADDHAPHAISAYGSVVNQTPAIDRIAAEGALMSATFCTNSICSPSRASILTGTYSHVNGVPGIFAAGDCTTVPFKQITIASGSGATAALSAFDFLIRTPAVPADEEAVAALVG